MQWIGACFDSPDQELSILAPNLSVTAFVLSNYTASLGASNAQQLQSQLVVPTALGSTTSAPVSESINVTVKSISTWGRTLSHLAGVPPEYLGVDNNASLPADYDAFIVDPVALADMYDAGLTLDLSQMMVDAPYKEQLEWVGIHQLFRGSVVVAEGAVTSLPLGGLIYQMYYRHDVLGAHNLSAPATWDEFLEMAAAVNGTDMNGDGEPDYGVCLQRPRFCFNGFNLAAIWSSFIQTQGTKQGAFFDPASMHPLVNNSAMAAAMEIYRALRAYGPPDEATSPCLPYNAAFVRGRCALTLSWGLQLKANIFLPFSAVRDRVSVALLPGSTKVLNRTTGELENCSSRAVCPYAHELPGAHPNGTRLVNRAPYLALATVSAAVSGRAGVWQQTRLMSLFAYLASRNVSWDLVTSPVTELGPYRYEHFDPANLDKWVRRGYPAHVISQFLGVMKAQVDSENVMLEVRTLNAYAYRRVLDTYATLVSEDAMDIPTAIAAMTANLTKVFGRRNPRFETMRRLYLVSIGYLDGVGPTPTANDGASGGSFRALTRSAGIGTAAALLLVVVASSCVIGTLNAAAKRRRRKFSEWRPMGHPGLGEDTTLLVSDVEGSTALWEAVEPTVMDVVFNLHHNCMRRTAVRYNGYESQTEGDSFIIAFHRADDAAHFALAVQAALLEEPWPQELLAQYKCRPVWLARTALDVPLDLPYEPAAAHLQHHHHNHHQRGGGGGGAGAAAGAGAEAAAVRQGAALHPSTPWSLAGGSGSAGATTPSGSVAGMDAGVAAGALAAAAPAGMGHGGAGKLDLRRLLARRGHSRKQLGSNDGGASATPIGSESLYNTGGTASPVAGGGARPDISSVYGSVNSGGPASSIAVQPVTPPAPHGGIDTVAEALRAMWREVSAPGTGLDPWTGAGGGSTHGGLARWQGVKAALKTTLSTRITPNVAAAAVAAAAREWPLAEVEVSTSLAGAVTAMAAAERPAYVRSRSLPSGSPIGSPGTAHAHRTSHNVTSGCHASQAHLHDRASNCVGDGETGGGEEAADVFCTLDDAISARTLSDTVPARGSRQTPGAPPSSTVLAQAPLPTPEPEIETTPSATPERGTFASSLPTDLPLRSSANAGASAAAAAARAAYAAGGGGSKSLGRRLATALAGGGLVRSMSIGLGRRTTDEARLAQPAQSARWDVGLWALRAAAAAATTSSLPTPAAGLSQRHGLGGPIVPTSQALGAVAERASMDRSGHGRGHGHGAPEPCTLVRRGLLVRIGMHTGVRHATDLQYSEVAARWKYSGEVLAAAKAVSDAANGGDVLISAATLSRLSNDFLTKRSHLLYLGRHVLRGGDADAAASAAEPPAPPAPGGAAELYGLYSPRLLPRLGLYRAPRTAQALGLSTLDAPLGCVSYGMLVCHGLGAMAHQHQNTPVVSEAQEALSSIASDQLSACHGVPAAGGGGGVGSVIGAFRNPYHAILWALQAQEDLLHHPWSEDLLAHEQFEAIVVPAAAADVLAAAVPQRRRRAPPTATLMSVAATRPDAQVSTPPTIGQLPPPGPGLQQSRGLTSESERPEVSGVPSPPMGGRVRGFIGGERGSSGGGANGIATEPGAVLAAATAGLQAPTPGLVWAFSTRTQTTKSNRSLMSYDGGATAPFVSQASGPYDTGSGAAGWAAGVAPRRSSRRSAPGDITSPQRPTSAGGAMPSSPLPPSSPAPPTPPQAAASATAARPMRYQIAIPYDTSHDAASGADAERDSANAITGHSLALSSGWHVASPQLPTPHLFSSPTVAQGLEPGPSSNVAAAAAAQGWEPLAEEDPEALHVDADGGGGGGGPTLPSLAPSLVQSVPGTMTGMSPAIAASTPEGEVVLFRGPRIKGAITYGPLKASLDPLTGRIRYEGKPVAQATKMASYAAIGMVVASVAAVESGQAEEEGTVMPDGTVTGMGVASGTPRAGTLGGCGGTGTGGAAHEYGDLRAAGQHGQAAAPQLVSRTDSYRNDPEGPSAAMAAAAAAAAAALLNLAPDVGGVFHRPASASHDLPLSAARDDALPHLATAVRRATRRAVPPPTAARRQTRTSDADGRTSDARSSNSGPLGGTHSHGSPAGESRLPSGYSTPHSAASYTYTHNPLFGFGGNNGGSNGNANGGAGGAGGGGAGSNVLKPDSRVPSRTARTMSNLNPDSRQASRTLIPRQSGLSMTGGNPVAVSQSHTQLAAAGTAVPHRSPSPDSLRRLAGMRGAMRAPPPALSRGASASRAEAAAAAAAMAADAARSGLPRATSGQISLLTSLSRRLNGRATLQSMSLEPSHPWPISPVRFGAGRAPSEPSAPPKAGSPTQPSALTASLHPPAPATAAAAVAAAPGLGQAPAAAALTGGRATTTNLPSRPNRIALSRHGSDRYTGTASPGANGFGGFASSSARYDAASGASAFVIAGQGGGNTAAGGGGLPAWRSHSIRGAPHEPASPSPPRPWASPAVGPPPPGQHPQLQHWESQRLFPGAAGAQASTPRAAAALPSVQVLSHGPLPGLQPHQLQLLQNGAEHVSGLLPTSAGRPHLFGLAEHDAAALGAAASAAAAAAAAKPQAGFAALGGPTHGSIPAGHSSYLNPLCVAPQLLPAAAWRSAPSGAPAPRGTGGAGGAAAFASSMAALLKTGSHRAVPQGGVQLQRSSLGRRSGPASGPVLARGTISNSGAAGVGAAGGGGGTSGGGWLPDSQGTGGLPKMLETVGLDEVSMVPVVLKKPTRANSQPLVVYLCRFASSAKTYEMRQRLVSLGHGEATAAAAAAAVAAADSAAAAAAAAAGLAEPLSQVATAGGGGTAVAAVISGAEGTTERATDSKLAQVAAALFAGSRNLLSGSHEHPPQAHSPAPLTGQLRRTTAGMLGQRSSLTGIAAPRTTPDLTLSSAGFDPSSDPFAQLPSAPPTQSGAPPPAAAATDSGGRPGGRGIGRGGGGGFMRRLRRASLDTGIGLPRRRGGRNGGGTANGAAYGTASGLREVRTMSVKRVQRGGGLSGPLNPLFAPVSATLPYVQLPHPMYGVPLPYPAAVAGGAPTPGLASPNLAAAGLAPHGGPAPYGVLQRSGGGAVPPGMCGQPVGGGGGEGGDGSGGSSNEEITVAGHLNYGVPMSVIGSPGDGAASSGAGTSVTAAPLTGTLPSQPLIFVGGGAGGGGGGYINMGVNETGVVIGNGGGGGGAGGLPGPVHTWEFPGAGLAPLRLVGSGRVSLPLSIMSPTEEEQEMEEEEEAE